MNWESNDAFWALNLLPKVLILSIDSFLDWSLWRRLCGCRIACRSRYRSRSHFRLQLITLSRFRSKLSKKRAMRTREIDKSVDRRAVQEESDKSRRVGWTELWIIAIVCPSWLSFGDIFSLAEAMFPASKIPSAGQDVKESAVTTVL